MRRSVQQRLPELEENRVHDGSRKSESRHGAVNKVHQLPARALAMAKADVGGTVKEAIEGRSPKEFGSKTLVSGLCSGEKVPDYLARIYQDPRSRRRLALAWLRNDPEVKVKVTIEIDGRHEIL